MSWLNTPKTGTPNPIVDNIGNAGVLDDPGIRVGRPAAMRRVHELVRARFDRGQHGRHADRMHHGFQAVLSRLVGDGGQHLELLRRRRRIDRGLDDLDARFRQFPNLGARRFGGLEVRRDRRGRT